MGGGLDGIPDIMFVNTVNPRKQKAEQYNGRLDYQATANDLIAFSTYQTPVNTTSFNGPARAANFWINDRLNHAETLMWNRTVSPTLLNEARISVSRWSWDEVESNPQEPWGLPTDRHRCIEWRGGAETWRSRSWHLRSDDLQHPRHGELGAWQPHRQVRRRHLLGTEQCQPCGQRTSDLLFPQSLGFRETMRHTRRAAASIREPVFRRW